MRAGLIPIASLAGFCLAWSPEILAQVSGDLSIEVSECIELTSELERYACYERLTEAALSQQAREDSTAADTASSGRGELQLNECLNSASESATGAAGRSGNPADEPPVEILSTITALEESRPNSYTVTLENGQIWRQIGSKRYPLRTGFEVRIYVSRWGSSYRLTASESGGYIQVERVR